MQKKLLPLALLATQLFSLENGITIMDKNSPNFLLGKMTHINMKFVPEDNPDMWLKVGVRIQGTVENQTVTDKATNESTTTQDSYLRRVRLEVAAGFNKYTSFTMDIRNDKANKGLDNDEGGFNVGDAYVKIKKPFDTSLVNFKLYRAKIDVSRTETVKSARVIYYDRPHVADAAAQYISFNRRASNLQMYGDYKKKFHYQVAVGSASSPDKIIDAQGNKASSDGFSITDQSFFFGGKLKLSPFDGWEEKMVTETYMGRGKHFTIGASYWVVPTLKGTNNNGGAFNLNRKLLNIEASAHYKGLSILGEYFKFDDMVKDWAATTVETGSSSGWYVTGEYVMPELGYIAPFARYESWDRWDDADGYNLTSTVVGMNWYLKGNTIKAGLVYQKDSYEVNTGNEDVEYIKLTSQFFF